MTTRREQGLSSEEEQTSTLTDVVKHTRSQEPLFRKYTGGILAPDEFLRTCSKVYRKDHTLQLRTSQEPRLLPPSRPSIVLTV